MKKFILTILVMASLTLCIHAQVIINTPVSIDQNLTEPDESAMLDIKSSTRGVLIPRMSSSERENIFDPANGLMVYDYDEQSFWYFNGTEWKQIGENLNTPLSGNIIQDTDSDTWVATEFNQDEDQIRFVVDSTEQMRLDGKTLHLSAPGNSIFIGNSAGNTDDETDNFNLFIGGFTGFNNTSGYYNMFQGFGSGYSNTTGHDNMFYGFLSGLNNTTGSYNNFLGSYAGFNNSNGIYNIFNGSFSGYQNTSGSYNIFTGHQAGYYNTTGSHNLFMGRRAGWNNTTGENNICLGFNSGYNTTTGERLVLIGRDAGHENTTGYQNVSIGSFAGYSNTTGYYNTFLGDDAGKSNTEGFYNTFIGLAAGWSNEMGNNNTYVGGASGFASVSGSENSAFGRYSLFANSTGNDNTALGTFAGQGNSTGNKNTYVGKSSGEDNTSGSNNTYLGFEAGKNNVLGSGNIFIGHQAGSNIGESNLLFIDNNGNDIPLIHGDFSPTDLSERKIGINRIALTNTLEIDGTASKNSPGEWIANSDERLKKNIKQIDSEEALQKLLSLKGINYEWNDNQTAYNRPKGIQFGFSAQNIQEVYPDLVREDNKGFLETAYGTYDPMFVEALRALNQKIEKMESENIVLKKQLSSLLNQSKDQPNTP